MSKLGRLEVIATVMGFLFAIFKTEPFHLSITQTAVTNEPGFLNEQTSEHLSHFAN
jgi:hypothetical protein